MEVENPHGWALRVDRCFKFYWLSAKNIETVVVVLGLDGDALL